MVNPWLALTFKAMQLGFDAQNVIALRMMRQSAGAGARENDDARPIVSEKIDAVVKVRAAPVADKMTGRKETIVGGKGRRVLQKRGRANKRRLFHK
jgi:hypothetical protein